MPKRDRSKAEGTGTGRIVSRRAVLAGVGVALCSPSAFARAPLRVGILGGLGVEPAQFASSCGHAVLVVEYDGWGALGDHAACGGVGLIDAAVLPVRGSGMGLEARAPSLWVRVGPAPARIGVPVTHPSSDAALRRLLGPEPSLVPLPTSGLWPNLVAGLIDAAVVPGDGPAAHPGLRRVPLAPTAAAALLPPLGLVLLAGVA